MVQGHFFYALLEDAARSERWYGYHSYVHGFTAPLFLFASGAAFGLTTLRRWDDHSRWGDAVFRRLERYVLILGIGYLLHCPTLKLSWLLDLDADGLAAVTRVDALHNIGATLLAFELLAVALKRRSLFIGVVAGLGLSAIAIGPWAWQWDPAGTPTLLAAFLNHRTGSMFPLVPWAGFIALGVVTARVAQHRFEHGRSGFWQLAFPLALAGGLLIVSGDRLAHIDWDPFPEHNFWKASPWFFMVRAGVVLSVLAALSALEVVLSRVPTSRVLRGIQIVGSQTLVIYVAHLLMLYGTGVTPGLVRIAARALSLPQAVVGAVLLLLVMFVVARVWNDIKRAHPATYERVRHAVTAVLILLFVLR